MKRSRILVSNDRYGISRVDDDNHRMHAWRVSLRRQRKMHIKNFPDKKYGGKSKALKLAKEYRDGLLLKYPPTTRKQFCSVVRVNNKSGIPGVYTYSKSYVLRDGTVKEAWYWEANWPNEKHENITASFSVKTYGNDLARQMAVRARKKGLALVNGVFWASERGVVESVDVDKRNSLDLKAG